MNASQPRPIDLAPTRRTLRTAPAISLPRPQVVLATSISTPPARRRVVLAEPTARPEAVRTQLGAADSLLASLADARQALGTTAARAERATTTQERVTATIAAYRAEAALDDVLTGAWRRVTALMEERGLR